ncbi:FAD/NAD(P)-binding domain-containing protein [Hesseltinella vesiculosa]|uniref:FAD/NAD(P)-binding domain-containing protein n=1 Tax=Hesseltinella vesiculosa TaxID=101127 RepID=A0A1X2G6Y5_9FUNG|nr:FAD/NAD(P)-binding domain-containing protein [Hesseltinella vesiculosa]
MTETQSYDVIVCGAGPVGLFMAFQLVQLGHSVYILDKKSGPTDQSRAFLLTPRTMEILQHHGIAYRILQQSLSTRGGYMCLNGQTIGTAFFQEVDTVFPQLTMLGQSSVETIFVEELAKLNQSVAWNTSMEKYEQQPDQVVVHITLPDGTTQVINAKYLVGADGSHSRVRKLDPTWTYEGNRIRSKFALADLEFEGPDVKTYRDFQCVFYAAQGCILLPLPHHGDPDHATIRMVVNFGNYEVDNDDQVTYGVDNQTGELTLEEAKRVFIERTGGHLKMNVVKATWLSYFGVNERIANGFRRGRAFLMGGKVPPDQKSEKFCIAYVSSFLDACHCHSPAGGQGMNIGLQDANNLAWKLSLALKGQAADVEKLLDSYSEERVPMVKEVMETAGAITRVGFNDNIFASALRYIVISAAFKIPQARNMFVNRLMQINFRLPESPVISKKPVPALIAPGEFIKETAPMIQRLVSQQVTRRTLYEILEQQPGSHTALWVMTRRSEQDEPAAELTQAFLQRVDKLGGCRPLVIQNGSHYTSFFSSTDNHQDAYWLDTHTFTNTTSLSHRLGVPALLEKHTQHVPPVVLVLLRPDRYVAYTGTVANDEQLKDAFTFIDAYLQ